MQQAFFIIILLLAAGYCVWTKQMRIALGFLILAIAFAFLFPGLATGPLVDIFSAIALILFALGAIIIAWKGQTAIIESPEHLPMVKDETEEKNNAENIGN